VCLTVGPRGPEERVICLALVTTWMLTTGRHMPAGVLPHELAAADLINFWADDFTRAPRPVALRPYSGSER